MNNIALICSKKKKWAKSKKWKWDKNQISIKTLKSQIVFVKSLQCNSCAVCIPPPEITIRQSMKTNCVMNWSAYEWRPVMRSRACRGHLKRCMRERTGESKPTCLWLNRSYSFYPCLPWKTWKCKGILKLWFPVLEIWNLYKIIFIVFSKIINY